MLDIPLCKTFTGDGVCSPILSRDNAHRQYIQGRCEWPRNWMINTSIDFKGSVSFGSLVFQNSSYYWSFGCYVSYYVNHPLYTPPVSDLQVYVALAAFLVRCLISKFVTVNANGWNFR